MTKILKPILFSLLVFMGSVWAQSSARIIGNTIDKTTGQGIRGVNVSIEGTYYGAVSDIDGKFSISTSMAPPYTLVFERASYSPTRVAVKERSATALRIEMQSQNAATVSKEAQVTAEEYNLKLLLLEKMISQITWDSLPADPAAPFGIGILGDNPFGDVVFALEHKTILGHPVKVSFVTGAEDLGKEQVIFIAATKRNKKLYVDLQPVLAKRQMLTVADDKDALNQPTMISFFKNGEFLKFSLQPELAEKVGIHFSPKLVSMGG